jgi:shikimate kinase
VPQSPVLSDFGVRNDKIYLVGFIAAGKTTVARALGRRLGWRVEDIDELIEKGERQSITEIFAQKGEPYFRALEREVVHRLLEPRHLVVATGAGTFDDPEIRAAINRDGASVWLDVPIEEIIRRLPPGSRRPTAPDRAGLERLYLIRRGTYQHAHLRLDASGAPPEELVERVLDWLGY